MYNLFISGYDEAWEYNSYSMEVERCMEYTSSKEKYINFEKEEIEELKTYPCIFAYESRLGKNPSFGYITDIQKGTRDVQIHFEKIEIKSFLTYNDLETLSIALGIKDFEFYRTHWAVKNVELDRVLIKRGIDIQPFMNLYNLPDISLHYFDVSLHLLGRPGIT